MWWIVFVVIFVVALAVIVCAKFLHKRHDGERFWELLLRLKEERRQRDIQMAGDSGEQSVRIILNRIPECKVFNNCYFDDNCFSIEIDHIVVNPYGIWVLETKNWKGEIHGSIDDTQWVHRTEYQTKSEKNPIKQNEKHVRIIKRLLRNSQFRNCEIHSFVVFVDYMNCRVCVDDERLIYARDLEYNLTSGNRVLSQNDINDICQIIALHKKERSREEHNKINNETPLKIEQGICPKCGRNLQYNNDVLSCECGFKFFVKK